MYVHGSNFIATCLSNEPYTIMTYNHIHLLFERAIIKSEGSTYACMSVQRLVAINSSPSFPLEGVGHNDLLHFSAKNVIAAMNKGAAVKSSI